MKFSFLNSSEKHENVVFVEYEIRNYSVYQIGNECSRF
jgi:hypothetical protein